MQERDRSYKAQLEAHSQQAAAKLDALTKQNDTALAEVQAANHLFVKQIEQGYDKLLAERGTAHEARVSEMERVFAEALGAERERGAQALRESREEAEALRGALETRHREEMEVSAAK